MEKERRCRGSSEVRSSCSGRGPRLRYQHSQGCCNSLQLLFQGPNTLFWSLWAHGVCKPPPPPRTHTHTHCTHTHILYTHILWVHGRPLIQIKMNRFYKKSFKRKRRRAAEGALKLSSEIYTEHPGACTTRTDLLLGLQMCFLLHFCISKLYCVNS